MMAMNNLTPFQTFLELFLMLNFKGVTVYHFAKPKGPVYFLTDVESHHWQGRKRRDWMHFRL